MRGGGVHVMVYMCEYFVVCGCRWDIYKKFNGIVGNMIGYRREL